MADICKFRLTVSGPDDELLELRRLLTLRPQWLGEGEFYRPEWVLELAPEAGGSEDGRTFFWAWHDKEADAPVLFKDGRLYLHAWVKWDPPVEWVRLMSCRFPSLRFELDAWMEDEQHDLWRAAGGKMVCVEWKVVGIQSEQVHLWVRDDRWVIHKDSTAAVNDEFLDAGRLAISQEYREEMCERVALLEQYVVLAQAGDQEEYRKMLAQWLAASEERINDLLDRFRADEFYQACPEEDTDEDRVRDLAGRREARKSRERHRYRGPRCHLCGTPLPAEPVTSAAGTTYCSTRCRAVVQPGDTGWQKLFEDGGVK